MQKVKLRRILENCWEFLLVVTCRNRVSESLFLVLLMMIEIALENGTDCFFWILWLFSFSTNFFGFSLQNFPFLKSVLAFASVAFGSRIEFDIYVCVVHVTHTWIIFYDFVSFCVVFLFLVFFFGVHVNLILKNKWNVIEKSENKNLFVRRRWCEALY